MNLYQHKKGGLYRVIHDDNKHCEGIEYALDVTNGAEERELVVYEDLVGKVFCRDFEEFHGRDEDGTKRFVVINGVSDIKAFIGVGYPELIENHILLVSNSIELLGKAKEKDVGFTDVEIRDSCKALAKLGEIISGNSGVG